MMDNLYCYYIYYKNKNGNENLHEYSLTTHRSQDLLAAIKRTLSLTTCNNTLWIDTWNLQSRTRRPIPTSRLVHTSSTGPIPE